MTIYLYVKQHTKTKLKYFGKTEKSDPYSYLGSGRLWVPHINKHGIEFVETIQLWHFDNQEEATSFALKFSEENNIVESNEWANLIIEDCLAGGDTTFSPNYWEGMHKYHSQQSKDRYATFGMKGKKQSNKWHNSISKVISVPVMCEGIRYESIKEAQQNYPGISLRKRLESPKYPDFYKLKIIKKPGLIGNTNWK